MNSISNVQFGSSTAAVAGAIAARRRSDEDPYYTTLSHALYQRIKNPRPSFNNNISPAIQQFNPVNYHQGGVRFGASTSDNFEDVLLHHAEQDIEGGATGWLLGKALNAGIANDKDRQKLAKYRDLPPQIAQGDYYLRMATFSPNPKQDCKLAEKEFLDAVRSTKANVHKSRAFRMAAISAKLRGENATARSYMNYAKGFLNSSGYHASDDQRSMREECDFVANQVAEPTKRLFLAPLRIVEGVARTAVDIIADKRLAEEEHYLTTKLTSPFEVKMKETEKELSQHYGRLKCGESSDDEWVDGKDRVKLGTSTGKGLRHPYRAIEIAEEKRVETQRKAAEDARRVEAQRKAAEDAKLAARKAEAQRQAAEEAKKAETERRSAEQARQDVECCKKTSFGLVAVIAMLWGLAALGKQD